MCMSSITARKYAKLVGEVVFYKVAIYALFLAGGRVTLEPVGRVKALVPVSEIGTNFIGCFLVFYLLIPFLNVLVRNLDERRHVALLALAGFAYVALGTLHLVTFNYVSWFCALYLLASWARLYPKKVYADCKFWGRSTAALVLLCMASVVAGAFAQERLGKGGPYSLVTDSNTLLAVLTAASAFMWFKNLGIGYSARVNVVASTTFGVLLIHANSDAMREWLWRDVVNYVGHYGDPLMLLYAVGSVLAVFAACSCVDLARIRLVEAPFLRWWDRLEPSWRKAAVRTICRLFGRMEVKG